MMLSPHFSLAEMTASATAAQFHIDNSPPAEVIERMRQLCAQVLEPVRARFGKPVQVNSGYRSPALNKRVRGSTTSQHMRGEAADIEIAGLANGTVAQWIREHLDYDQLILENYKPGVPMSGWVHVSWRPNGRRGSVLTFNGRDYLRGLVL